MAAESQFKVTADDLRRYDWQAVLKQSPNKDCHEYYSGFIRALQERQQASDDLGVRVYRFLAVVTSFHPNYDADGNPYGPMMVNADGSRTVMAEDLTDDDLAALKGVLPEIADPEFRSRVADVLWASGRDFKAAQEAVRAFLASAELHKGDDLWPAYAERLERAIDLAASLGYGQPLHLEMLAQIEAAIANYEKKPRWELLLHRLMNVAAEHGTTKAVDYAALSEKLARELADAGDWNFAERYWKQTARWHRILQNEPESKRCLLSAAECYASVGEAMLTGPRPSAGSAAHWTMRAVEAMRQAGGDPSRISELHRRLLDLQRQSLGEMGPLTPNLEEIPNFLEDEKKSQAAAAAFVSSCGLWMAIGRMARINEPTDAAKFREQFTELSKGYIWDKVVSASKLDASGKVADIMAPSDFGEDDPEGIRQREYELASNTHWPIIVNWRIEPARRAIIREHALRLSDLAFLVEYSPLIPPGHEGIILRGLQAGFFGDWLVAMHLLVPQVEGIVRHVLQQRDVITSTLLAGSIQEERDLNQLLRMPEAEESFGPDVLFDLRGILIERFGHNLRNSSAHAMIPTHGFYQPSSIYLWWLILWLCWRGYRLGQKAKSEDGTSKDAPPDSADATASPS
ncbi:MAG TPA: DUF4209 domain-containing protein [Candidatus Didemnitutus sp.]|jgi:hypothetical protein